MGKDAKVLHQAVLDKYKEEEDCAICSFSFNASVVMVPRPCCKQVLCKECNEVCHGKGQPCAFCRWTPGSALESSLGHNAERGRRASRYRNRMASMSNA